ncbi:uncharacterized protein F4812DRAFT_126422 [Daldinia caldariorum]|uniref:uncharacterized protein n=1 Tax=Daldinia caldariorum TaxID=326644 RepID=UPI0020083063|nr:uncharacterized protein F4812DRAFT_126422 [Daldinia caldariorum]KAI1465510.1 hypothetical protein F4812DRAFT_126422 [Daldinia caldariorum]
MRPSTFIIAISATVLATPLPRPVLDDVTNTLVSTIDTLLGVHHHHKSHDSSKEHEPECRRYDTDALITCINRCVDICEDGDEDCSTCMKGCSSKNSCGRHHGDTPKASHSNNTINSTS